MLQIKTLFLSLFCILALMAGCSRQEQTTSKTLPDGRVQPKPDEVLVSIDGNDLTYADAIRLVKRRLGGPPPEGMAPQQIEMIERRTFAAVVDDFIRRELLLSEARRIGIEPDEEKVAYALEALQKNKQDGAPDPSGFIKEGPDSLRHEIVTGLMIETLLAQELPAFEEPTDEDMEQYLQEHPKLRTMPARARARHIFLTLPPDAPKTVINEVRSNLEDIRQRLIDGADFGQIARTVSQDATATSGGDMGVIMEGNGDPAILNAVFTQKIGETGEIIQSQSGLHIIEVLERTEPRPAKKTEILAIMKKNHRAEELAKLLQDIRKRTEILHSPLLRPAGKNQM